MIVCFSLRATQDLSDIADYIREPSPSSALRVRDALLASLETLARFPNAGRCQSTEGVRKFVASRYAYLVYYTVDEAKREIVILTIQHPARCREFVDE